MSEPFNKIANARTYRDRSGLIWIESQEQTNEGSEDPGDWYDFWLLVQPITDRVIVVIDGPTKRQLTYGVAVDGCPHRKFLSIEGAKRWSVIQAMQIIQDERREVASNRMNRKRAKTRL